MNRLHSSCILEVGDIVSSFSGIKHVLKFIMVCYVLYIYQRCQTYARGFSLARGMNVQNAKICAKKKSVIAIPSLSTRGCTVTPN